MHKKLYAKSGSEAAQIQKLTGKIPLFLPSKKIPEKNREIAARKIAEILTSNPSLDINELKFKICEKYKVSFIKNSEILKYLPSEKKELKEKLLKSPTRTLSGVSPIALMPPPAFCGGSCIYCPKGENAPQSYTGFEPTTMRAIQNNYSARKQILARLNQYKMQGHPTDKCHIIIMGGTFLYAKREERFPFMKEVFETLNNKKAKTLKQAIDQNEYAAHKAIGVTFETRPDYGFEYHANEMLLMGGTQVELGVQVLSDKIYKKIKRGHSVNDVIKSSQILKDCGFKILYHMMPGLFSTPKQDVSFFKRLFSDQRFRPDMLKIYPALVIAGTQLYAMWKNKEFEPYDTYQAAEVIAKATEFIPPYVRISRIQRDIPSPLVSAGVKNSNLRQIVEEKLREEGKTCRCIRCREIGRKGVKDPILTLKRIDYKSSFGKEVFLSFEDERYDAIAAFLRLRLPFRSHRKEINLNAPNPKLFDYQKKPVIFREKLEVEYEPPEIISSIVREIHVYGQEVSIGKIEPEKIQHKGLGKRLLIQAEEITKKEFGLNKIAVISGPGARGYYKKLGYFLDGVYMSKNL